MSKSSLKVTCAIIIRSSEVLVAQRGEQMSLPLKWEFPGGKVAANETEEECVLREIFEELNIEIEIVDKLEDSVHHYENVVINLIPFICNYKSGSLLLSEHKKAKWLCRKDLVTLDWAAADLPILNQLLETRYV
jgi:8-oxo-dGTP diphosphatase